MRLDELSEGPSERQTLLAMIAVVAVFLVMGVVLQAFVPDRPSPVTRLGDLSDAIFVEVRTPGGEVLLSGELRARIDPLGNIEKDAALIDSSGQRVIGEVEIEVPAEAARDRRQELEVDIIALPPDAALALFVNDRKVASFVTDDRGGVDFEVTRPSFLDPVLEHCRLAPFLLQRIHAAGCVSRSARSVSGQRRGRRQRRRRQAKG